MKPNKLATFLTGIISLAASANAQTNFTILKSFTSVPDGNICYATLVPDTNGWLYGTTFSGGTYTNGTIFAIRTNAFGYAGTNTYGYVKLASFNIATNGALPYAGVTLGSDGNFYGTTYTGGTFTNGVIFMAHKDGSGLVALHSFVGGPDGKNPQAGLIEASDGALYGTTYFSDSTNRGTIFKINKDGSGYSVLHIFTGNPDGQQPQCRLLEGSDGMLYGTAAFGGSHNKGTVFSLSKDGSVYNSSLYAFGSNTGDGGQSESGS